MTVGQGRGGPGEQSEKVASEEALGCQTVFFSAAAASKSFTRVAWRSHFSRPCTKRPRLLSNSAVPPGNLMAVAVVAALSGVNVSSALCISHEQTKAPLADSSNTGQARKSRFGTGQLFSCAVD